MDSPTLIVRELGADVLGDIGGVGLDLVNVALLSDLIAEGGQPFLDACWTATEQADCERNAERLAGRWAAKEAVMKCLGVGIGEIDPIHIEIITLATGAPQVVLHAEAAGLAHALQVTGCLVSMTHEHGWAAAIAIAQGCTNSHSPTRAPEGPRREDLDV